MTDSVNYKSLLNEKCQTINKEFISNVKVMPTYKTAQALDDNGQIVWQTQVYLGSRRFENGPTEEKKINAELQAAKLCLSRIEWLEREIYIQKKAISDQVRVGQTMCLTLEQLLLFSPIIPANVEQQMNSLFEAIHGQSLNHPIKFLIQTDKNENSSIQALPTWSAKIAAFKSDECLAANLLSPGWAESSKFCKSEQDAIEQAVLTLLSATARETEYRQEKNHSI